ncbi:MAG TPA: EamA family transporter RarD [Pseudonocardia sp.]|nr:EamA family transporter RarD [Pseudonocardia sp.]
MAATRTGPGPRGLGSRGLDVRGVAQGVTAHVIWGLFPAFWPLLDPAAPIEVLAHRILWTLVLMAGVLTVVRGWGEVRALSGRGWLTVSAAAVLIATNWGVFIYGVAIDQVVEIALGYYTSPLFSVLLAVLVLRERPRPAQWAALGIAAVAVVVISVGIGRLPWLGLALGLTFGLYGLMKKTVPIGSGASLTAEGIVLAPLAAGLVVYLEVVGSGTLSGYGPWHVVLLALAGPVTAVPLLLYGAAAHRIPLTTLGTLLYLTPTLQFLWGVLVVGEPMPTARWVGFALVWLALGIFTFDLVRQARAPAPVETDRTALTTPAPETR